ncbi:T9SS type A sorting domain-containing protein [candidate division WOR-3 bacterium]|uniref:T9SS type A sorting domain-containing protein n=1 Tax=candidate division WOR-3 bacterium TaxID=2052148 RepID=A0A937XF32_UNCW3|nr:T9SS type A sorting domain-containing protein [candidate division WOR-3 bacterium]
MTVSMMRAAMAVGLLCASAVGLEWKGFPPAPRQLATIVIDKPNRRAVMFGGGSVTEGRSDVWTLSLDAKRRYTWESLPTSGPTPGPRVGHTAIYDPVHHWMVIFGGRSGMSSLSDVWALDLGTATWQQLTPTGTPPSGKVYITAVYSPVRRSMVIFGGVDEGRGYNDVHELLLDSMKWRVLAASGAPPEARWSYNAFYGSGSEWCDRLIIFGGQTPEGQFINDLWSLDLTPGFEAWHELNPGGSVPEGRSNCATCFDTVARRAYFFGGFYYPGRFVFYNDLYMLDMNLLTWTKLQPMGRIPSERRCPGGAYDPWNDNFITFGGETHAGFSNESPYIHLGQDRELRWQGFPPAPRSVATIIIDELGRQAVLYGGGASGNFGDVWTLSLDGKRGYAWESLPATGTAPTPRHGHTAIYDPVLRRMIVFGGRNGMTLLKDVWALDLGTSAWQRLYPTGTPPPGPVYITGIYSPIRRSLVVFGGNDLYTGYNDVYELLLDSLVWRKLSPSGPPPAPRWSYNAFYGSGSDWCNRLVIFGGQTYDGHFVKDLWSLDLTPGFEAWHKLIPGGVVTEGRSNCATCYDSVTRRAYFFGGFNYERGTYYNDLYMLDLKTLFWIKLNPAGRIPSERRCPAGAFDPWNRNLITFGGQTYGGFTNEWPYIYVGEAPDRHDPGPGQTPSLQVSSFHPRRVSMRFLTADAGKVSVRVMDQSGRVVRNLLSGTMASGSHVVTWDGRDTHGRLVGSGIYFYYLQTGDAQESRKFVLAR